LIKVARRGESGETKTINQVSSDVTLEKRGESAVFGLGGAKQKQKGGLQRRGIHPTATFSRQVPHVQGPKKRKPRGVAKEKGTSQKKGDEIERKKPLRANAL